MYINPFLAGVLATIIAEIVIIFIVSTVSVTKKNKED